MIKKYMEDGKTLYEVKVFVKSADRKQRSRFKRGITSEREAKKLEFDFKFELQNEVDRESQWTWSKWHEEVIRKMRLSLSPSTILQYDGRLKKWIPKEWQHKLLTQFTDTDVHAAINSDATSVLSSESRLKLLKLIRRVFEMAVEEGAISRNPTAGLRVKTMEKPKQVLTAVEADILLREGLAHGHGHYPLWAFALMSGMRSGEMYALRWPSVDMETGTIRVNVNWTNVVGLGPPKSNKTRVVPMSANLKKWLTEYRLATTGFTRTCFDSVQKCDVTYSDYVLPNLRDWTAGAQAQVLRDFCSLIGITPLKFHDLRATFITNLLANNVPLVKVMSVVGHSKMSTTDVYVRLAGVNVRDVTEALSYEIPETAVAADVLRFKPKLPS